jgi:hypothetical protein
MANRLRGESEITLGGVTYHLRPTFAAIMEIEDRLGGVVPLAVRAARGEFGLKDLTVIVWATLNAVEGQKLELAAVGDFILERGIAETTPMVRDVLTQILGGSHDGG